MQTYYVYIMSNASRTLYVGVTSNLGKRVWQHRHAPKTAFTGRYHITRLVYFETAGNPWAAIAREKEIKGWRRARKIALVEATNPTWNDLAERPGFFLPA